MALIYIIVFGTHQSAFRFDGWYQIQDLLLSLRDPLSDEFCSVSGSMRILIA